MRERSWGPAAGSPPGEPSRGRCRCRLALRRGSARRRHRRACRRPPPGNGWASSPSGARSPGLLPGRRRGRICVCFSPVLHMLYVYVHALCGYMCFIDVLYVDICALYVYTCIMSIYTQTCGLAQLHLHTTEPVSAWPAGPRLPSPCPERVKPAPLPPSPRSKAGCVCCPLCLFTPRLNQTLGVCERGFGDGRWRWSGC